MIVSGKYSLLPEAPFTNHSGGVSMSSASCRKVTDVQALNGGPVGESDLTVGGRWVSHRWAFLSPAKCKVTWVQVLTLTSLGV